MGNPGLPLPALLAKKFSCCVSYCLVDRVSRSLKKGQGGIQKKGTWCALSHSKRAHSVRARYA